VEVPSAPNEQGSDDTSRNDIKVRIKEGDERVLRECEQWDDLGSARGEQGEASSVSEVNDMKYAGVSTSHPKIVDAIKSLKRQGKSTEHIMKVVGMPYEIVKKVERDAK